MFESPSSTAEVWACVCVWVFNKGAGYACLATFSSQFIRRELELTQCVPERGRKARIVGRGGQLWLSLNPSDEPLRWAAKLLLYPLSSPHRAPAAGPWQPAYTCAYTHAQYLIKVTEFHVNRSTVTPLAPRHTLHNSTYKDAKVKILSSFSRNSTPLLQSRLGN